MMNPYDIAQVQFQLRSELGQEGQNSKVFLAHDPQLDAEIVIKKIEKTKISNKDEYFFESSTLYKSAHSNVVPIYYACEDPDFIYLAMPYFQAGSLKTMMNQRPITVRQTITLGTQFLSAIHHIHSKGLIHFDIKPDNILISSRGEAVLSDFGLAKQTNFSGIAGQDRLYGKCVPPEAFSSDQHTNRLDIYQAGLTLYRMCNTDGEFYRQYNGFLEPSGFNRTRFIEAIRQGRFPDRNKFPEHIPSRLKRVVQKCLQPSPVDRYRSALEVVNDLAEIDGEILDWEYRESGAERKWTKVDNGYEITLSIAADGSSTAMKKNLTTSSSRRIADYCKPRLLPSETQRFLRGD